MSGEVLCGILCVFRQTLEAAGCSAGSLQRGHNLLTAQNKA